MESIILSAIITFGIFTAPVAAPSDTTNKYYINDELVESFDGSQIVGHKITAYRIDDIHTSRQVVRIHHISTETVEPRYILNTIQVSKAMADSVINTGNVSSIKVFKGIETGSLIVIMTKDQAAKEEEFKRLSQIKAKEYKEKLKREGRRN